MDWNEMKEIMNEVSQLFQHDEDFKDIQDISKMTKEIDLYYQNNIKYYKDQIKSQSLQLSSKEAAVTAPTEDEHMQTIRRYIQRKEEFTTELNQLRELINLKRESIQNIQSNIIKTKEGINEVKIQSEIQDSRHAYAYSLYSKISHISWNHSIPGKISGHIMNDKKCEFQQFELESSMNSFELTNKLWELIETSVE